MSNIDWDKIINNAFDKTDEEFASEFSGLTRLTDDELKDFIKTPSDKKIFANLIAIVKDTTKSNAQKAQALSNIDGALDLIVPLLGKLI